MAEVMACGYVGVRSSDLAAWRAFAADGLGLQVAAQSDADRLLLRIDERTWRISVEPGDDGVAYIGWEVGTPAALAALEKRLVAAGVEVRRDDKLAALRMVDELLTCVDPGGNNLELFCSARVAEDPFVSPHGARFVTTDRAPGDLGFGHVVVTFDDVQRAREFYFDLLGFKLSDVCLLREPWVFAHVNPRHHSLAFGPAPGPSIFHHFMLEVTDLDMVGLALDRLNAAGAPMVTTLGRHTNDLMFSFYVRTPSGFEIEYGCHGRKIDDATWMSSTYESASVWGHKPIAAGSSAAV
jgi:3,4-dihydroxy-9,10-secoandrosta-1,3,5(10)-triene-9,17-dione 4,5-dioxygenase